MEFISKLLFGTYTLTMTGENSNSSFNISKILCDSWAPNYGVIDHMTPHSSLSSSNVSFFGNHIATK